MTPKVIERGDWIKGAVDSAERTLALYKRGKIPHSLEGWMLVVSIRRLLRAIYGSDLRAAFALLGWAVKSCAHEFYWFHLVPFWHIRILRKTRTQYLEWLDTYDPTE